MPWSCLRKNMKIDFEFDTQYGKFSDALYLPDDHEFSDTEIAAMQQQRLSNWLAILSAPPEPEVTYTLIAATVYRGSDNHIYTLDDTGAYTQVVA